MLRESCTTYLQSHHDRFSYLVVLICFYLLKLLFHWLQRHNLNVRIKMNNHFFFNILFENITVNARVFIVVVFPVIVVMRKTQLALLVNYESRGKRVLMCSCCFLIKNYGKQKICDVTSHRNRSDDNDG